MLPFYAFFLLLLPISQTNGKFYIKYLINPTFWECFGFALTCQAQFDVFLEIFHKYAYPPNLNHCVTGCQFEGLLASCPMTLGGHHVHVSARINHCHNPIDVYFLVEANNDRNPSAHNTDTVSYHPDFSILVFLMVLLSAVFET